VLPEHASSPYAGDRTVEVAAGDVAMDVAPVVFGSGKRYFGSVGAQHLLETPTW
jgi:hypothetical protein